MSFPHSRLKTSLLKDFLNGSARATAGSVAVWTTLTLPVLVGGAALSVDAARIYNVDAELQAAADALAKAGAAELDQRGDSINRSSRAVLSLLKHDETFAKGTGKIEVDSITYYTSVPANDYEDMPASARTNSPSQAAYVEVKVKPKTVETLFPSAMLQKLTDTTLTSKAVAGMDQVACGAAPVFICNPFENTNVTIHAAMEDPSVRRRQFKFTPPHATCEPYGKGNFGWLDTQDRKSSAYDIAVNLGIDIPKTCYSQTRGVKIRTGSSTKLKDAFNTRFDIYAGSFASKKSDPSYAPAANVVKGYAKDRYNRSCSEAPSYHAMGLPRDKCLSEGGCTDPQLGNGNWDFASYMAVNHPGFSNITIEGVTYTINARRKTFSPVTPPSRYAMYRWEIDNNCVPGSETYGNNAITSEEGLPQCHTGGASTTVEDRRVLTVAVLNCAAIEAESSSGMFMREDSLPVETFVKIFLTEPMQTSYTNTVYAEIVGPSVKGDDAEANDLVAVVR